MRINLNRVIRENEQRNICLLVSERGKTLKRKRVRVHSFANTILVLNKKILRRREIEFLQLVLFPNYFVLAVLLRGTGSETSFFVSDGNSIQHCIGHLRVLFGGPTRSKVEKCWSCKVINYKSLS